MYGNYPFQVDILAIFISSIVIGLLITPSCIPVCIFHRRTIDGNIFTIDICYTKPCSPRVFVQSPNKFVFIVFKKFSKIFIDFQQNKLKTFLILVVEGKRHHWHIAAVRRWNSFSHIFCKRLFPMYYLKSRSPLVGCKILDRLKWK